MVYRPQTLCKDVTGTNNLTVLAFCLPCTFMFGILFWTDQVIILLNQQENIYNLLRRPFLREFLARIPHYHRMHKTGFQLIKKPTETGFISDRVPLLILLEVGEIYSRCSSLVRISLALLKCLCMYLQNSPCAPSSTSLGKWTFCSE